MVKKYFIGILVMSFLLCFAGFGFHVHYGHHSHHDHHGCNNQDNPPEAVEINTGIDRKPVIYLYPEEDGTEVSVRLDYNGNLVELIPEYSSENTWEVVADKDGTISFDGQTYDYLFWEGDPSFEYDFFSGFCVKGSETESFLNDKLHDMGLSDSETAEFIDFWLPRMEGNEYNVISFQGDTYKKGAKLTITPQPDNLIRVFMAWYPSDKYIKINPQYIEGGSRDGFTVVEWGGNQVK